MFFTQDRRSLRRYFFQVWIKAQTDVPLEPLEQLITQVIRQHPEYHSLLARDPDTLLDRDFTPDDGQLNPFLHLALHLAIYEQVGADRPSGIRAVYYALANQQGDAHAAEHLMLEALGEALWTAQRNGVPPDETAYLNALQQQLVAGA